MKAQDIKEGMKYTLRRGDKIVGGWKATGDAVVEGNEVFVPVKHYDGGEGTRVFDLDMHIPVDHTPMKTVYVVEETGATFTFTDLDAALATLKTEILEGMDASFRMTQAPANLKGNDLAEWVASND